MEKELLRLFEAAKKAADVAGSGDVRLNGRYVLRCMDALKQLGSFPMTKNLLVSSMVYDPNLFFKYFFMFLVVDQIRCFILLKNRYNSYVP